MKYSEFNIWTGSILFAAFAHGLLFMQWNTYWGENQSNIESHSLTTRLNFKISEPYMPEPKPEPRQQKPNTIAAKAQVVEARTNETAAESEPQLQRVLPPANAALIAQQREHYLKQLMAHIEKFKYYPRAARRRNIEGEVTVSFKMSQDGRIAELIISSDYGVLKQAAADAIESALPLPLPSSELLFSKAVKFNMRYMLN